MRRRLLTYAMIGLAVWGAGEGYARLTAPGKFSPDLARVRARGGQIDVVVDLGFAPEAIHVRMFQKIGTVVGIDHSRVRILGVAPAEVDRLARRYWIRRLDLLRNEPKG